MTWSPREMASEAGTPNRWGTDLSPCARKSAAVDYLHTCHLSLEHSRQVWADDVFQLGFRYDSDGTGDLRFLFFTVTHDHHFIKRGYILCHDHIDHSPVPNLEFLAEKSHIAEYQYVLWRPDFDLVNSVIIGHCTG